MKQDPAKAAKARALVAALLIFESAVIAMHLLRNT